MHTIARLSLFAMFPLMFAVGDAYAGNTPASCQRAYDACDRQCNLEDPKHGLSYATCSAGCVASKAKCEGGIIYDKSADWTSKQYNAAKKEYNETAKPWIDEKSEQASEAIDEALKNSEQEYPK